MVNYNSVCHGLVWTALAASCIDAAQADRPRHTPPAMVKRQIVTVNVTIISPSQTVDVPLPLVEPSSESSWSPFKTTVDSGLLSSLEEDTATSSGVFGMETDISSSSDDIWVKGVTVTVTEAPTTVFYTPNRVPTSTSSLEFDSQFSLILSRFLSTPVSFSTTPPLTSGPESTGTLIERSITSDDDSTSKSSSFSSITSSLGSLLGPIFGGSSAGSSSGLPSSGSGSGSGSGLAPFPFPLFDSSSSSGLLSGVLSTTSTQQQPTPEASTSSTTSLTADVVSPSAVPVATGTTIPANDPSSIESLLSSILAGGSSGTLSGVFSTPSATGTSSTPVRTSSSNLFANKSTESSAPVDSTPVVSTPVVSTSLASSSLASSSLASSSLASTSLASTSSMRDMLSSILSDVAPSAPSSSATSLLSGQFSAGSTIASSSTSLPIPTASSSGPMIVASNSSFSVVASLSSSVAFSAASSVPIASSSESATLSGMFATIASSAVSSASRSSSFSIPVPTSEPSSSGSLSGMFFSISSSGASQLVPTLSSAFSGSVVGSSVSASSTASAGFPSSASASLSGVFYSSVNASSVPTSRVVPPASSVSPTASSASTSNWLPAAIITQSLPSNVASSSASSLSVPTSSTNGIASSLPKAIAPQGSAAPNSEDSQLVQIGFDYSLNYPFVVANPLSAAQIFQYLPPGLSYGLDIDNNNNGNVSVKNLEPYQSNKGYIVTVALCYVPSDLVSNLAALLHTPTSRLYNNPDSSVETLVSLIDPSIPLIPGGDTSGTSSGGSGGSGSGSGSGDGDANPTGGHNSFPSAQPFSGEAGSLDQGIPSTPPKVSGKTVGIAVGAVAGAIAYGGVIFLVSKKYRQKRQLELPGRESPLTVGSLGGRENGVYYDDMSTSDRSSGLRSDPSGSRSLTSSRRHVGIDSILPIGQQISQPVMSENSLGWT